MTGGAAPDRPGGPHRRGHPARAREAGRARARCRPAWRTSSTTRRRPRGGAPPTWPRPSRSCRTRSTASSRRASSASEAERLVALQREALARAAEAPDEAASTRSTPPSARTSSPTRSTSSALEGWRLAPSRWPRPGSTRRGSTAVAASAGAGHRRRGGLGGRLAHRPRARCASCTRPPSASPRSSARSRRTPTWTGRQLVEVDVHEGLETTLAVLGHKLKHRATSGSCATTTASCRAHRGDGSELNQVWTNLLDNAIDALGGAGRSRSRTRRDGGRRRRSRSPTTARASRRRSATASSTRSSRRRTSGAGPASGSTSSTGRCRTIAARCSCAPARRARPSRCACPALPTASP